MKIKLYSKPSKEIPSKAQVCLNRGMLPSDIPIYLKNRTNEINPPEAFGENLMKSGAKRLIETIGNNKKAFLIVDSDCDGMTSAAHLINYLYELFPSWVENNLEWGLHEGKQHGINDFVDSLECCDYSLLLVPDAGTNDIEAIERLHNIGCETLILDHHISDVGFSEYAITINSQYNYPNKELSGVGVVHKFCKFLDKLLNKDIADKFKDLTAIGLMGDMMDLRSLETKEMIFDGLKDKNIVNPLIAGLTEKNAFSLNKSDYMPSPWNDLKVTPMGAAFFIIPLLNAICRSGTSEEKEQVFNSMLTMRAFKIVPSTKRGHKLGEEERILEQALRTCTNVKNRQTRCEESGMELLTSRAEMMLNNKVLVFALEPGEISPTISGLVANKLASKYQRPVYVLFKNENGATGSGRGYTMTGIDNMKVISESSEACDWCRGHENAHGCSLNDVDKFVSDMNETLKDISTDIVYYVDYIFHNGDIPGQIVIDLAEMNDYLGTGFARPQVYVENLWVCEENLKVMAKNTLRFVTPTCDIIKFAGTDEEIEQLMNGCHVNMVCKPVINEWNCERNAQLICIDYEIIQEEKDAVSAWNF